MDGTDKNNNKNSLSLSLPLSQTYTLCTNNILSLSGFTVPAAFQT